MARAERDTVVGCWFQGFVEVLLVIGSERADYNCKCYHKPSLMPAGGEMNWHVGVKLRAESAGGRTMSAGSASVVNGPEE